ncbi:SH3 domain-containing protein [Marinobacter sp. DSM 26671]|jgi:hypothetical protein|uniref:SH3 domain-containing protein n=1 Tax=unclassified Marinobacter TaxID=83889 RepID=UPI0008EC0945|nr:MULTISPECIES: SH3 domain-containing protein [unclassified Marinobacter]MAK51643.1 SH3 domain-containing protein [Marinobacter sp.]SFF06876.1 SH3 domain-containing protein [Marinobacter sp. DSM 26671]|tara:strand:- start:274 stop:951 length:678 start_codon:yes stop_codon:yes gene_type:complete
MDDWLIVAIVIGVIIGFLRALGPTGIAVVSLIAIGWFYLQSDSQQESTSSSGADPIKIEIGSGEHFVTASKLNVRLAPNNDGKITNVLDRGQRVEVFETKGNWARISEYYDGEVEQLSGEVARWVYGKYLSTEKHQTETLTNLGDPIFAAISSSDDFEAHQDVFVSASKTLINNGRCQLSDFQEVGGWVKSVINHKLEPVYFTYCGGMTNDNRIYLNVENGETFK